MTVNDQHGSPGRSARAGSLGHGAPSDSVGKTLYRTGVRYTLTCGRPSKASGIGAACAARRVRDAKGGGSNPPSPTRIRAPVLSRFHPASAHRRDRPQESSDLPPPGVNSLQPSARIRVRQLRDAEVSRRSDRNDVAELVGLRCVILPGERRAVSSDGLDACPTGAEDSLAASVIP